MAEYGCTRCGRELPAEAFSPSQLPLKGRWCRECHNESRRNKRAGVAPTRITDVCLTCGADIRERRSHALWCSTACAAKGYRAARPGRQRDYRYRHLYGMTASEVDALLEAQGGRCAICRTADVVAWNLDHDHATGAVRGVLCPPCNVGLGHFGDSIARLRDALGYLERHATV